MKNKEDESSVLLGNEYPHIVAFTETWLQSDILDDEITFNGYQMFKQDRSSIEVVWFSALMPTTSKSCTHQLSC